MRRNIREETNSFVGRADQLARVGAALRRERLVTLAGGAGVGKSRLALRAVTGAAPEGVTGIYWADLWPLQDDELLATTVADALGLADHTPRMPLEALSTWVADQRVLLVLDSCEHLIPQCRRLLGHLLTACPRLTVLVTSRERLWEPRETVLEVPPLAAATEAVELFAQRATAVGAPLAGEQDRRRAVRLCERLEGVPLALELAAAQLRHHTLAETAERIRSGLDLSGRTTDGALDGGVPAEPVRPARHGAVRTAVGWSHELCRPTERLLWARLSALPHTFEADFAERVCGGGPLPTEELRSCLAGLVNKSVVVQEGGRYRLLETIREYGHMWLCELAEEREIAGRHAAVVLELSRRARAEWLSAEQQGWYARIAERYHDVHEALRFLLDDDPEAALELAGNVAFFWVCCGHLHEANHYLEQALAAATRPSRARTQGLWALGVAHVLQGDHSAGREFAASCARSAAATRDPEGARQAAYLEGLSALLTGSPREALETVEEALTRTAHEPGPGFGVLLCRLVRVFALTGAARFGEARAHAEVLREECVTAGEFWTRSYADYQLALIALFEERPAAAVTHARDMLGSKRRIGDRFGIALGLELLAAAWAASGAARQAALAYGAGAQHWQIVGHPQRGTPEVAPLRDRGQAAARERLGEGAYDALFAHALHADRDQAVTWATAPGPGPRT